MKDFALVFDRTNSSSGMPYATLATTTGTIATIADRVVRFTKAIGMGDGKPVRVVSQLLNDISGSTNLTSIQATLAVAPDNAGSPGSFVDVIVGPTILKAAAIAGAKLLDTPLPNGIVGDWYKITYTTVAGGTQGTAAKVNSWLSVD